MSKTFVAKYKIGQVARHRVYPVRGVVFDVDPEYAGDDHAKETILIEGRQPTDQPFYYLLAGDERTPFVAYVSEQNLLPDASDEPLLHPQIDDIFERDASGSYRRPSSTLN